MNKIIIAIDGYSSCGKSTLAKSLARELGYIYIDSGAMYRAVTLYALRKRWIKDSVPDKKKIIEGLKDIKITFQWDYKKEMNTTYLNGENVESEIRQLEVSNNVSPVSTIPEVREEMVRQQRLNAVNKGIVMDGRDIGSTVFPDAELKIFMSASAKIRAERRYKELIEKNIDVTEEEILKNIQERDLIDSTRAVSPLKKADDAIELNNDNFTQQDQLEWALEKAQKIINS